MNTDLIIAILLSLSIVGLAVLIVVARLLTGELNTLIDRMYRKVDNMQHNEEVLMNKIQQLEAEKAKRELKNTDFVEGVRKEILRRLQLQHGINVVDKPLDFPNEDNDK